MSGDRARFLTAGANDYLPKPVSPDQLFAAISRVIDHQLQRGIDLRPMTPVDADNSVQGTANAQLSPLRAPRLRKLFLDDCDALLAELERTLCAADFEGSARAAHSLKGSSGQFGEDSLEHQAATAEHAARSRDAQTLADAIERLQDDLSQLKSVQSDTHP
jgi:HPt (histidine-containing phosphotransfer) domain-containing protein